MVFSYETNNTTGFPVFKLKGELIDRAQANDLLTEVDALIQAGQTKFILDMSELKYINSSGLSVLIILLTKARKNDGDVVIAAVRQKVQELLVITKLNTVFSVTKDTDQAAKKLK